ncbi:MAG: stealth family protein [Alphaproteobacteria bacterium]|nr:stealth family protein [Alphaproteobacteria bacterium]
MFKELFHALRDDNDEFEERSASRAIDFNQPIQQPIDLVYLWVNGNDPKWRQKKAKEQAKYLGLNANGTCDARFIDNQELKYSLRSVHQFLPWMRKIFIVTDKQRPDWLKNHPKIQIVDHKDIFPKSAKLPSFNSMAIELCLPNIKDLGEYFIYLNDDFFFGRPIAFSFFFNDKNLPISYAKRKWMWKSKLSKKRTPLYNTRQILYQKLKKILQFSPEHSARPYRKSWLKKAQKIFDHEINQTLQHQFRNYNDVNFYLYDGYQILQHKSPAYALGRKRAMLERLSGKWKLQTIGVGEEDQEKKLKMITKHKPYMFCLNDNERATNTHRKEIQEFLKNYFPKKSPFEK